MVGTLIYYLSWGGKNTRTANINKTLLLFIKFLLWKIAKLQDATTDKTSVIKDNWEEGNSDLVKSLNHIKFEKKYSWVTLKQCNKINFLKLTNFWQLMILVLVKIWLWLGFKWIAWKRVEILKGLESRHMYPAPRSICPNQNTSVFPLPGVVLSSAFFLIVNPRLYLLSKEH